jgi:hypothetical protein
VGGHPTRNQRNDLLRQAFARGEEKVDSLLVKRPQRHVVGWRVPLEAPFRAPAVDCRDELSVRFGQALRQRGRVSGQGGVRGRRLGGLPGADERLGAAYGHGGGHDRQRDGKAPDEHARTR